MTSAALHGTTTPPRTSAPGSMKVLAVDDGFVAFQRLVGREAIGRATAEVA